jgi:hypothetical protein
MMTAFQKKKEKGGWVLCGRLKNWNSISTRQFLVPCRAFFFFWQTKHQSDTRHARLQNSWLEMGIGKNRSRMKSKDPLV